ncbi:MAG TPA: hypothetical protein VF928_09630 [Usitatibacteraceae bacterium]
MITSNKYAVSVVLLLAGLLSGCSSTPWHENLMSNEQLIAADCKQLAVEEQKAANNAQSAREGSTIGTVGAVFLAVLEGVAASASKTPMNTNNSAAMNSATMADEHTKQAAEFENRRNMISMIRGKKGCT